MNKTQTTLLRLIKNLLISDDEQLVIQKSEWRELYSLIIQQNLVSILYPVINRLPKESQPEPALQENWKNNLLFFAGLQIRHMQQMKIILDQFDNAKVPVIVIKGPAIARFYEYPECRFMSDLDVLIEDKYMPLAQRSVEAMGYQFVVEEENHPMHKAYFKDGQMLIELHYSLLEPGILGWRDMRKWYGHIWENKEDIIFEGLNFSVMPKEDELINQVLHMATHMFHGGSSIRHLYDIALFINHCGQELDWNYVEDTMKDIRLLQFGKIVYSTCHDYFGIHIPEHMKTAKGMTSEQFMERFVNEYCVNKKTAHQRVWQRLAWKMPVLCRSLITLPIVYVLEYWVQLTKHKRNPCSSMVATYYNMQIFADRVRTLRMLGMND